VYKTWGSPTSWSSATPRSSIDLLATGVLDVGGLVTHRLPLADYRVAIDVLRAGDGRKIQFVP